MKIVVTGNIGCGKSTVVRMMQELLPLYHIFDFDAAVHERYEDETTQMMLTACFGTHDRKVISDIVHADPEMMKRLRAVMDAATTSALRKAARQEDVILDIPLYFEFEEMWNIEPHYVVCVAADETTQIERVMKRNGFSEEKVLSIMAKQLPQDVKIKSSDFVIINLGTLTELKAEVEDLVKLGLLL